MAEATNPRTGTPLTEGMTQEQFEALLKKDVSEWLTAFLSNFPFNDVCDNWCEDNEDRPKSPAIEDVQEYEYYDAKKNVLGFYIKHVESEGGEYDGSDLTEVFAIYKDGKFVAHFAVDGHYSSYEYSNFNDYAYLVEKKEVKVMKWLAA